MVLNDFALTSDPIDSEKLEAELSDPESGAFVAFSGRVRNHNEGKAVKRLQYEVYEELALKEGRRILDEAHRSFGTLRIIAIHRHGSLEIGETAVWVGVVSGHREEAFRACRYIIDELKQRLPIWKKEHYKDGKSEWVNCQACAGYHKDSELKFTEKEYYSKQTRLSQFGDRGQDLLRKSRALVIGAGGLGCPALSYLASAGVGRITICDGDLLEASNLHRQGLYSHRDIGKNKAHLAKNRLIELNPFVDVKAISERASISNIQDLVSEHDVVLDCSDNFETKFLIHDACFLSRKTLVQASIYQLEGQVQTFRFGQEKNGCMRCVLEKIPEPGSVGNCVDVGVLGVGPGVLGTLQASEAIRVLLKEEVASGSQLILVDLSDVTITKIKRSKNPSCPLCAEKPTITELRAEKERDSDFEINLENLRDQELSRFTWVDIREDDERNMRNPWEGFLRHEPLSSFSEIESERDRVLLVCQSGVRSQSLANKLRKKRGVRYYSLGGGITSVRENWYRLEKTANQ